MCSKGDKNLMQLLIINPSSVSLERFKNMQTFALICKKILYGSDDERLKLFLNFSNSSTVISFYNSLCFTKISLPLLIKIGSVCMKWMLAFISLLI
jgi:hypothetical protein